MHFDSNFAAPPLRLRHASESDELGGVFFLRSGYSRISNS